MTNKQSATKKNVPYAPHPDRNWFNRIYAYFFLGGTLLSIIVIFLIVNTESGRTFASNPMLREFILDTFPNAQLWVYSTLKYQQEIVLIYLYHILLLLWAGGITVYLFIFNGRRMLEVQKDWFIALQVARDLCTFKTMVKFILGFLLLAGFIFIFGFGIFEPSLTPMNFEDSDYSPEWNSYTGLVLIFVVKIHLIYPLILVVLLSITSMLMCFKRKAFYSPK